MPPAPTPRKQITCGICYEEKPAAVYGQRISNQCRHRIRTTCNQCIYRHVVAAFDTIFRDDIRCLEPNCTVIFDYDAIKNILVGANNKDLFDRYDRFRLEQQLEQMPDFIWCAHGCGSGQLATDGAANNIVTCVKCRKRTCFIHRTKWHEGLTCTNYDQQINPERQATKQWFAQKTKSCPRCRSPIEKISGCDHMTCSRCQCEFCWACLADYANIREHGNHYHNNRCKHYRPNQNWKTRPVHSYLNETFTQDIFGPPFLLY